MAKIYIIIVLITLVASSGCKKERDPKEYLEDTYVTFKPGKERPGVEPPLKIIAVSSRTPDEIKYFAVDNNGKDLNDLSEFEIMPWHK
ncbi:hypothetical protein [Mucilaginibacter sp.]|uniref:hypothetical protein n=1 Tax=Mucilaginibacter sp. TaxID=1882438 RepID=UPI0035BC86F9